ncbi:hypothetical protein STFE110948_01220 [Streptobacillus felis]|uniref:Uncharacterized protein n=1 Tax=Streptobacillus felis TaxID=1384509 RepID=A0A7Z0PF80_9FUSO|nr:hypothetical protein [Streptobacillus felis]NYV27452.1 hypothetical protein [Streptobacillus felis]
MEDLNIEYEKLHNFARLFNIEYDVYKGAVDSYNKDLKNAVLEYIGFEDTEGEIQNFETFFYYLAVEETNAYFHNYKSKNYTKGLKRLVNDFLPLLNNIDFEDFEKKENEYEDVLINILISEINYNLRKEKKSIVGFTIGLDNIFYLLIDNSKLKEMKNTDSKLLHIIDLEYLEKQFGIIYKLKDTIPELSNYLQKGDYIMEPDETKGSYITLFDKAVKKNLAINYLTEDQKKLLKVVL